MRSEGRKKDVKRQHKHTAHQKMTVSRTKHCLVMTYEKDIDWEKPVRVRVPSVCVVRQTAVGVRRFIKIYC